MDPEVKKTEQQIIEEADWLLDTGFDESCIEYELRGRLEET